MASVLNQRPFFIVDGKETQPVMRQLTKLTEDDVAMLKKEPIPIAYGDKVFMVNVDVSFSQLDGKAVRLVQGRTAAYCVCCSVTREMAHDLGRIESGKYFLRYEKKISV